MGARSFTETSPGPLLLTMHAGLAWELPQRAEWLRKPAKE